MKIDKTLLRTIREWWKNNLEEMNKFLETYSLLTTNHVKLENLIRTQTNNNVEISS
jgi:hypothetical protein